jgi:hypothetical protein
VAVATAVAAIGSGLPSTVHALFVGADPLAAVRAAGTLLPGRAGGHPLVRGVIAHLVVSGFWGGLLAHLPRRHPAAWGALAGAGIAAFDLGVVGRRFPAIRSLPRGPQVADHVAFGTLLGWVLGRQGRGPA